MPKCVGNLNSNSVTTFEKLYLRFALLQTHSCNKMFNEAL